VRSAVHVAGSPQAQQQFTAALQCLIMACPNQDQACIQNAAQTTCGAQFAACLGGGKPGLSKASMDWVSLVQPMHLQVWKVLQILDLNSFE
jgi:hypothetical protein